MYCPKCGMAEQTAESYCRQCGTYLPDLTKPLVAITRPEEHVKANLILGAMTVVTSFALAILLYLFVLGLPGSQPAVFVMFGLLLAMGIWHIQTVWRSLLLRKHFKESRERREQAEVEIGGIAREGTQPALKQADFENFQPASVADRTTRELAEPQLSAKSK